MPGYGRWDIAMTDEIQSVSHLDVDALFKKYEAKIVWDDKIVRWRGGDSEEETIDLPPERCHWTLVDKCGVISLEGIQEIADARTAAALFLYLWGEKKVPVAIAQRCALAHVMNYIVKPIDDEDRDRLRRTLGELE